LKTKKGTVPSFLEGIEVAVSKRVRLLEYNGQLSLLEDDSELRRKLTLAFAIVTSVFFAGILTGIVLGFFV